MAWFIAHIVRGYRIINDENIYSEEHIHSFQADGIEKARAKAKAKVEYYRKHKGLKVINNETLENYDTDFIGAYLRCLMDIRDLADDIEDDGEIKDKSELSYMPMIFKCEHDFSLYANGVRKRNEVEIRVYSDPSDHHYGV